MTSPLSYPPEWLIDHNVPFDETKYATPCTSDCKREIENGICIVCKRTSDEISNWFFYSNSQRDQIISELINR